VGPVAAIDHNLYIKGDYAYQSNYRSGLRILHIGDLSEAGGLEEVAFFDTSEGGVRYQDRRLPSYGACRRVVVRPFCRRFSAPNRGPCGP